MTEQRTVRDNEATKKASSIRSGCSGTTTKDTEPGVFLCPQDLEAIRTGYVDILGPLNAIKARDIERAIQWGLDASAILDALEQTALAARPSHAYFAAVVNRYIRDGIKTAADAEKDREAYAARREAANRERAAWYTDPADTFPW